MPRFDEAEEESSDLHLLDTFLDRVDQVVGHVRGAEGCGAARVGAFPVAFLVLFDMELQVVEQSPAFPALSRWISRALRRAPGIWS